MNPQHLVGSAEAQGRDIGFIKRIKLSHLSFNKPIWSLIINSKDVAIIGVSNQAKNHAYKIKWRL